MELVRLPSGTTSLGGPTSRQSRRCVPAEGGGRRPEERPSLRSAARAFAQDYRKLCERLDCPPVAFYADSYRQAASSAASPFWPLAPGAPLEPLEPRLRDYVFMCLAPSFLRSRGGAVTRITHGITCQTYQRW